MSEIAAASGDPCRRFDRAITALGTGTLAASEELELREHIVTCARCAELADLYASAGSLVDARPTEELPATSAIEGRYRLERVLGRGGMGVVWAATQLATRRRVAVKLFSRAANSPKARRRVLREARAACAVDHPNVVRVLDVIETERGPAIVMELLVGHSLQRRFDRGPMEPSQLCALLAPVAAAIEAAHASGVVHRDLKPDNVFVARGPTGPHVKVLDFGVAKLLSPELASVGSLTHVGAMVGTPFYMAPEQLLGEAEVDGRADVWALGLMLYQGLSGVLPTRGDNLGQVLKAVTVAPFAPLATLTTLAPEVPEELARLCDAMLTKEPSKRPRDFSEARAVLARYAADAIDPSPELDLELPPPGDEPSTEQGTNASASPPSLRPGRRPAVAVGIAAVTAAVVVAAVSARQEPPPSSMGNPVGVPHTPPPSSMGNPVGVPHTPPPSSTGETAIPSLRDGSSMAPVAGTSRSVATRSASGVGSGARGWTQASPPRSPSGRVFPAMVYDSKRGITVLFGGCNGRGCETFLNDTWEWDGTIWTQRSPAQSPSGRSAGAMAFDGARGVAVLFGGCAAVINGTGTCVSEPTDTWEWDGSDWAKASPAHNPPGRTASANMVFDVARRVTILFGGHVYRGGDLNDTWEWDGSDWRPATPPRSPSVRCNARMAYDLDHRVTVLFGGAPCGGISRNDTWQWDGTRWTEQSPVSSPSARDGHVMAYDEKHRVTVLFGGSNDRAGLVNDTWAWDGTTWTQASLATSPIARAGHSIAYDEKRGISVVFGGTSAYDWPNTTFLDDTWIYDP